MPSSRFARRGAIAPSPPASFFRGPHETALEPDELLTAVRIPAAAPRTGAGFHEVSARYRDFAQVAAAATVTLDEVGTCTAAELVLLRVAPAPHRVDVSHLVGTTIGDAGYAAVAESLSGLEPADDIEVSGTYRRRVAATLALRALRDANEKARATT